MSARTRRPPRRAFGEITRLPSGRYRARFRGPDGGRHTAPTTFLSRLDAEYWLAAQDRAISQGEWKPPVKEPPPKALTFGDYAKGSIQRRKLRPGTVALYEKLLRLEILPTFGAETVTSITSAAVATWYAGMASRPTQQANAYGLLKSIFGDAVDDELIVRNPCRVKAGSQKTRRSEIEVLSVDQLTRYLDALPADRRMPLLLAGWCGLRSGEVRGLRVKDLDLAAGVVRVRQGIVRLKGQLIIQPPKTAAGVRDVAIPPHLLPLLQRWLDGQARRSPDTLLFPAGDGVRPLNDTVLRDAHYKGRAAIGIPNLTIHGLRHTSATMAAQQGATIAELQARIGHSTPNMALRYQHVAAERDKQLAARISAMATGSELVAPGHSHGTSAVE